MTGPADAREIARIAEGLDKRQRRLLVSLTPQAEPFIFTYWPDADHSAMQRLQMAGLFDSHPHWNARWNDLGLAVRSHLLAHPDGGVE